LVQSRWSQQTTCSSACYNYYTPPGDPGTTTNYPCGCVATAMAQLMRFHQHPSVGVGTACFDITVDGATQTACLRGGDGAGGPYSWASMVIVPGCSTTLTQRQAIGALCYDAGVAVSMQYAAGGSGAYVIYQGHADIPSQLMSIFKYSSVKAGWNYGANLGSSLNAMANPALDAGYPVLLGINGSPGGHAVVCDGYGYDASTLYHHLNMGWSGTSDAWYNLPTIDTVIGTFSTVYGCIYNVYPTGTGEIISGRVTEFNGQPLSGVTVTATRTGGGTYTATTNSRGIYALVKVPSGSTYTVCSQLTCYGFACQTVTTGTSANYGNAAGNRWGVDFVGTTQATVAADFSAIPTTGGSPLAVQFTDISAGGPTSWSWSFGDGGTSTLRSPSHSYTTPGTYTVSLTARNSCGADTETKIGYVTVGLTVNFPQIGVYQFSLPLKDPGRTDGRWPGLRSLLSDVDCVTNHSEPGTGRIVQICWWQAGTAGQYVYGTLDDLLDPGRSYFIQVNCADSVDLIGDPFILNVDVEAGWNMIGAPTVATDISTILGAVSITSGPWTWVSSSKDYTRSNTLEPGKGYWIQAANAGTIGGAATSGSLVQLGLEPPRSQRVLADFADVSPRHWAYQGVSLMKWLGITRGWSADQHEHWSWGTWGRPLFNPDGLITRAQLAMFLTRALKLSLPSEPTPCFVDVPLRHWANRYVEAVCGLGIMGPATGSQFQPDARVTRAQLAECVARSAPLWPVQTMLTAALSDLRGQPRQSFPRTTAYATRAELAMCLYDLLEQ